MKTFADGFSIFLYNKKRHRTFGRTITALIKSVKLQTISMGSNGTEINHDNVNKMVGFYRCFSEKISDAFFSEMSASRPVWRGQRPSGKEKEKASPCGKKVKAAVGHTGITVGCSAAGMREHAADNGKSGERAHDDGIPEKQRSWNTEACRMGFSEAEAPAAMAEVPIPASLVKTPLGNAEACRHKKGTAAKSAHSSFFRESRG